MRSTIDGGRICQGQEMRTTWRFLTRQSGCNFIDNGTSDSVGSIAVPRRCKQAKAEAI